MKVLFHTNTLNYRGTTVAVSDYAKYNQEVLGNESVILYNKTIPYEKDMGSEQAVVDDLSKTFNVISYDGADRYNEIKRICDDNKIDVAYFIKSGARDGELPPDRGSSVVSLPNTKTVVHAVFQVWQPHGDVYAYVSEWLAHKMTPPNESPLWVPHMVDLPPANKNLREKLSIPKDAFVFGRLGGYDTFDLRWVHTQIEEYLNTNKNVYFVFANTRPFSNHPNIRYVKEIITKQGKSNFINSCDAMVHARSRGESFGLSIAEFLHHDKPVVAWEGGVDQNHLHMLSGSQTLYGPNDFKDKLTYTIEEASKASHKWRVKQFQPIPVMEKFKEVFL